MSRVSGKRYFVYILWSASGRRFYIGVSEAPADRLIQHNASVNAGWTGKHRPWELVLTEEHRNYSLARRRELDLKAQKGGAGFFAKTGLDPRDYGRGS